jgi:radical SAM superfamily enzyme
LALERKANKVGLKTNENKTKYMIVAGHERTIRDIGQSVAFGDKTFEVVKKIVIGIPGDTRTTTSGS